MFPTFMYVHSTLGTHISCTLYRHTLCVYYSAIRAGAGFGSTPQLHKMDRGIIVLKLGAILGQ